VGLPQYKSNSKRFKLWLYVRIWPFCLKAAVPWSRALGVDDVTVGCGFNLTRIYY